MRRFAHPNWPSLSSSSPIMPLFPETQRGYSDANPNHPPSRIEGHARVVVEFYGSTVLSAHFQATSLFLFTMPDFPGQEGLRSIFHFGVENADLAPKALQVRRAGTELIALAGGQFIHPVRAAVGGVTSGVSAESANEIRSLLMETLPTAQEMVDRYWEMFLGLRDRIGTLGDDTPSHYLGAISERHTYYGGDICVLAPDGREDVVFPACDYEQYLEEVPIETSYSNGTLYHGDILRANSLARVNMLPSMGTPLADAYLARFQKEWGPSRPRHPAF